MTDFSGGTPPPWSPSPPTPTVPDPLAQTLTLPAPDPTWIAEYQPPSGAPQPERKHAEPLWKNRWLRLALALILLLVGVLFFVTARGGKAAAGEIFLEGSDLPGTGNFTPSIAAPPPPNLSPAAKETPTPSAGGTLKTSGGSPGLYGGQRNVPNCNAGALISYLEANPNVARPWAAALGFGPGDIRGYVNTLTPATLRVDTRVTDYGLSDGRAVPRQSILQAGTGVLLDRNGFPRVRCAGGNPLGEAQPVVTSPTYTGPRWPGFSPTTIVVVTPAPTPPPVIILIDVVTGDPFGRVPGSIVIVDIDRPPADVDVMVVEQGERMEFVGTDWPAGTAVALLFDDPASALGGDVADGGGNVRIPWTVPPAAPVGFHRVTAEGGGFAVAQEMYVIPPPIRIL